MSDSVNRNDVLSEHACVSSAKYDNHDTENDSHSEDELLIVFDLQKLGEYVVMQSIPERLPPLLCRLILSATEPVKQAELEELGLCGNDFREHRQVVALASLVVNQIILRPLEDPLGQTMNLSSICEDRIAKSIIYGYEHAVLREVGKTESRLEEERLPIQNPRRVIHLVTCMLK
jgi:hypothetical protein